MLKVVNVLLIALKRPALITNVIKTSTKTSDSYNKLRHLIRACIMNISRTCVVNKHVGCMLLLPTTENVSNLKHFVSFFSCYSCLNCEMIFLFDFPFSV